MTNQAATPRGTHRLQEPRPSSGIGAPMWHEQDAMLREMWLAGVATDEIASKLGRSFSSVMTRAARLGLPRRNRPGRHRKEVAGNETLGRSSAAAQSSTVRRGRRAERDDALLDSARAAEVSNGLLVVGARRGRHEPAYVAPESASPQAGLETIRAVRICLMCLSKFHSQGRHNRICRSCKSSSDYALAGVFADVNIHASER